MELAGNTILVTGGTSGIGWTMAEAFVKAGSKVLVCGRRDDRLADAKAKIGVAGTKHCDVAIDADRRALAEWAKVEGVNVLVNNAGIQRDIDFTKGVAALEGANEIATNLEAPIALTALFVPFLRERPNATIVHVTSGLGFVPAAKMPVYSATKAALHSLSLTMRFQLGKIGIRVIEVIPPAVDTELNPEGRKARGGFKPDLKTEPYVADVMKQLAAGAVEIGYGPNASMSKLSREEAQSVFEQMNARM